MTAVLVALPTVLDLKHALYAYGSIVGCFVTLWGVATFIGWIADQRAEHRAFVIRRLMEGDKR